MVCFLTIGGSVAAFMAWVGGIPRCAGDRCRRASAQFAANGLDDHRYVGRSLIEWSMWSAWLVPIFEAVRVSIDRREPLAFEAIGMLWPAPDEASLGRGGWSRSAAPPLSLDILPARCAPVSPTP